jgi:hypothetical protein
MRLFTNSEYAYEHRYGGEDADAETEGSRGIGFRIRELVIQVCEFGKGTVKRKPKDYKRLKSDSQINDFQFFKVLTTKAHESLWNQNQSY